MKTTHTEGVREVCTPAEMADRLKVAPSTLRRWALQGKIPSIRQGRKFVRFVPGEVIHALAKSN